MGHAIKSFKRKYVYDDHTHARHADYQGRKMTKSELINRLVARNDHLLHSDVARMVNTVFDEITNALAQGDRVELRGFGAFSVKTRSARTGRNPRTGQAVEVSEKFIPYFKSGKMIRDILNGR